MRLLAITQNSRKELAYELEYQRLPEELTTQLEKDIGGAPFSLKTLEEQGVLAVE